MRVICTGISGTGRLDWLRQVVDLARDRGRDVLLYDVWDTMFEIARAVGESVDHGARHPASAGRWGCPDCYGRRSSRGCEMTLILHE